MELPSLGFVCFGHWHDDVIKWRHFPRNWSFVRGIHRLPLNSPRKGKWREAFMFSFICAWIHGWVNNRQADDWRRHRAHYDVTVKDALLAVVVGDGLHHATRPDALVLWCLSSPTTPTTNISWPIPICFIHYILYYIESKRELHWSSNNPLDRRSPGPELAPCTHITHF